MKTVILTCSHLPRSMTRWCLLVTAVVLSSPLLFAQTKLPLKPESRVADRGDLLSPRREERVSRSLNELFAEQNISIHVVVLKEEPEILLPQLAQHLFYEWLDAPICGLAITYPGYPKGVYLMAGGPGVPEGAISFINRAIAQSTQAGELERDATIELIAVIDTLSQTLTSARVEIERFKRNPGYGQINTGRTPLRELFPFLRGDVFLAVAVALVVILIIGISMIWFRMRRPLRFPEVIPRTRYGGRFSGGNNIRVSFVTRRSRH